MHAYTHHYTGAEVAFYFVATYTRALWAPAAIGVGIYLADSLDFDLRLVPLPPMPRPPMVTAASLPVGGAADCRVD